MEILLIILIIIVAILSMVIICLNKSYDPGIDINKASEEEMKERINFIKSKKRKRSKDWELSAHGRALRDQNEIDEAQMEIDRRKRKDNPELNIRKRKKKIDSIEKNLKEIKK